MENRYDLHGFNNSDNTLQQLMQLMTTTSQDAYVNVINKTADQLKQE